MTYSRPKLWVWGRAGTEVRSPSHLLIALSIQHISSGHCQGMGDKGSDQQLRTQQPWKALQSSGQASAPYVDRVIRRGKGDEAPGRHIVFDEAIRPSDKICWTRHVWSQSVSQPGGCWAGSGSGLAIHGMKVYSTRITHPLYSLPTPCFPWPLQKK